MRHTTGAIAKYGTASKKSKVFDNIFARPLDRTPSAMAKPAPSNNMMFQGSLLHLFQSINFSPVFFLLGTINSKVATITYIVASQTSNSNPTIKRNDSPNLDCEGLTLTLTVPSPARPLKRTPHPGISSVMLLVIHKKISICTKFLS
jgi:hypothetical protein